MYLSLRYCSFPAINIFKAGEALHVEILVENKVHLLVHVVIEINRVRTCTRSIVVHASVVTKGILSDSQIVRVNGVELVQDFSIETGLVVIVRLLLTSCFSCDSDLCRFLGLDECRECFRLGFTENSLKSIGSTFQIVKESVIRLLKFLIGNKPNIFSLLISQVSLNPSNFNSISANIILKFLKVLSCIDHKVEASQNELRIFSLSSFFAQIFSK